MSSTKVSKRGSRLAIRIPRSVAKRAGLSAGDAVVVELSADGNIVVRHNPEV